MLVIALLMFLSQRESATPPVVREVSGPDLYRAHCAACHGVDGRGDGPSAAGLRSKVPDLTVLSKRNGGKFPRERTERIILYDDASLAIHGTRNMPVWGPAFSALDRDRDLSLVRARNLSQFLESLQKK